MTKVFLRDGFIDRYSGEKLLFPGIFRILQLELPNDFPAQSNWKMKETHMVYWELFPTIDHVIPIARGGKDTEDNWVTTSMKRNSAKANWLLDEIGWTLNNPGDLKEWDGLVYLFLDLVKVYPELLTNKYISTWQKALLSSLSFF
ncbi:MAG: HNH endonuclease [Chitinophagales bacterium]|nr:HNH endonuclease [Chitinophagales bacterium]